MDTFELMSNVRNLTRLHTESEIPTQLLLAKTNMANSFISQALYPLFKDDLIKSMIFESQTGNLNIPNDVLLLVNVYRQGATQYSYNLANKVSIEHKPRIGSVQIPATVAYPVYVQMGGTLQFVPALATTNVTLEYRKRIASLVWGTGASDVAKTYITMDSYAPVRDDILNGYWLALYKDVNGDVQKQTDVQITDYTAATKRAVATMPDASTTYIYASTPILPDEFHNLIIDYSVMLLARSGYYKVPYQPLELSIINSLAMILKSHGYDYLPFIEGRGGEGGK